MVCHMVRVRMNLIEVMEEVIEEVITMALMQEDEAEMLSETLWGVILQLTADHMRMVIQEIVI